MRIGNSTDPLNKLLIDKEWVTDVVRQSLGGVSIPC
jgi:hypothetical protein